MSSEKPRINPRFFMLVKLEIKAKFTQITEKIVKNEDFYQKKGIISTLFGNG